MSIQKMSATVRQHITSRLKEVITNGTGDAITERKLKSFADYTSSSQIRKDTDTVDGRHESIMSRGAFLSLLNDMRAAVEAGELSQELNEIVSKADFEAFVAFISEKYYKDKEFLLSDNRRVKGGFIYSGPTRATRDTVAIYAKSENRDESARDVLLLKNIPHGRIVDLYIEYLTSNSSGMSADAKRQLRASLQGGHLTGVFTARLIRAFGLRKDTEGKLTVPSKLQNLTELERQLGIIVDLVTSADYLSSNIALDATLFTETDKRLYSNAAELRLTTEVQFAAGNKEAGNLLTTAGRYLSNLIAAVKPGVSQSGQDSNAEKAYAKLLENLRGVNEYVRDRARQLQAQKGLSRDTIIKLEKVLQNQATFETLLNTEGSPSIVQHISAILEASIVGNKVSDSKSSVKIKESVKLGTKPIRNNPGKLPAPKRKKVEFKAPALRQGAAPGTTLASLQLLLDLSLSEQIRQNMGTGNRKDVLNYRTGRFAESAKVTNLTTGREGMITAYYTYMKNPYATFSAGGRQASPRTRDPKLLISKSIREILATQVSNRMRAVLV